MARDSITIGAPPERIFAILAQPGHYAGWVTGTSRVFEADRHWPAPGSSFRYEAGLGPLRITDRTLVLAADPPRRLELLVEAGPLPDAAVVVELAPSGDGTRVTLDEHPARPVVAMAVGPLGHFAISRRNRRSLAGLKRIVEEAP